MFTYVNIHTGTYKSIYIHTRLDAFRLSRLIFKGAVNRQLGHRPKFCRPVRHTARPNPYIRIRIHTDAVAYAYTYAITSTYTFTYLYMYIYIHMRIHVHIYTHDNTLNCC